MFPSEGISSWSFLFLHGSYTHVFMYEHAWETYALASYLIFKHYCVHVFHVHNTHIIIASINFCRKFENITAKIWDFSIYKQYHSNQLVIVNRNILFIYQYHIIMIKNCSNNPAIVSLWLMGLLTLENCQVILTSLKSVLFYKLHPNFILTHFNMKI